MAGLRENLNKYPLPVLGGVIAIVAIVLLAVHHGQKSSTFELSKAYYTTDDGETFTVASVPRSGDTGDKVQAIVFACSTGGKPFVGYLQRQGPNGAEVKKPGAGNAWVAVPAMMMPQSGPSNSFATRKDYEQVTHVTCPDGGIANLLTPE